MATAKKTTAPKTTAPKATAPKTATARTTASAKPVTTKAAPTRAASTKAASSKPVSTKAAQVKVQVTDEATTAGVDLRAAVVDGAYATLGATDRAVAVARDLPKRLEDLSKARVTRAESFVTTTRTKVTTLVKEAPTRLQTELQDGARAAQREFTTYASRGRDVVQSVTGNAQAKRAIEQTENARTHVKAAVTSIRKAVEQGQGALEVAGERIGVRRSA